MRTYCRAYFLRDLRAYAGWASGVDTDQADFGDDDIVYLWDDYTVVRSPVLADQGVLWASSTEQWRAFCTDALGFDPAGSDRSGSEPAAEHRAAAAVHS